LFSMPFFELGCPESYRIVASLEAWRLLGAVSAPSLSFYDLCHRPPA